MYLQAPRKTVASGSNGVRDAQLYESTAGPPSRSIAGRQCNAQQVLRRACSTVAGNHTYSQKIGFDQRGL